MLGQLGNRVQHALRAFTPRDQKAVKSAAETFRSNPAVNVVETISTLGVGQALISFLDEKGMPTPVEVAYVYPPKSQLAPITEEERAAWVKDDDLYAFYKDYVDNESAFEVLNAQADLAAVQQKQAELTCTCKKLRVIKFFSNTFATCRIPWYDSECCTFQLCFSQV